MTMSPFASGLTAVLALALLVTAGCKRRDTTNYLELEKQRQEQAGASAEGLGIKVVRKSYPQGQAWAVDLSGKQVTDATFDMLKKFDHITELNLSKTNITDAQMARVNAVGGVLLKLDLSNTAVSDSGLEQLKSLLLLTQLNLSGTKVTPAGVAAFKQNRAKDPRVLPIGKSPLVTLSNNSNGR
jgi:hypothetical protein